MRLLPLSTHSLCIELRSFQAMSVTAVHSMTTVQSTFVGPVLFTTKVYIPTYDPLTFICLTEILMRLN